MSIWVIINIFVAFIGYKYSAKHEAVSFSVAVSLLVIALLLIASPLTGVWSFVYGSMLYTVPVLVAVSGKFNRKTALIATSSFLLALLEVLMCLVWMFDLTFAYSLYEPIAFALYVTLTFVCMGTPNGYNYDTDSYYSRN